MNRQSNGPLDSAPRPSSYIGGGVRNDGAVSPIRGPTPGLMPTEAHQNVPYQGPPIAPAPPQPVYPTGVAYGGPNTAGYPNGPFQPKGEPIHAVPQGYYPNYGPILGHTEIPKGKWLVSRRWIILLMIIAVAAIIAAIVAPIIISNQAKTDREEYYDSGPYIPTRTTAIPTGTFLPKLGVNTMAVTYTSRYGDSNICSEHYYRVPSTLTIYPSLALTGSSYTAAWSVTTFSAYSSGSITDSTAYSTSTGYRDVWQFYEPIYWDYGDCRMEGRDTLNFIQGGEAGYTQRLTVSDRRCTIGTVTFSSGDSCTMTYAGSWR